MSLVQHLLYFICEIVMSGVMLYCIGKISNRKLELSIKQVICLLIFCVLIVINNLYNYVSLRLIISIIISIIMNKIAYSIKIKDSIKFTLIYYVVGTALELFLSFIFVATNLQDVDVLNNYVIFKFVFSLIHSICQIIIFKNQQFLLIIKKCLYLIYNSINIYNLIMILFIFLNIIMIFKTKSLSNDNIVVLTTICIVFMAITIRTIVNDKYIIKVLSDRNKNLTDSYKALC